MSEELSSFYKSREWLNLRARLMLERVNDRGELICEHCGKPIVKAYDCIGHHTIELTKENVKDYSISLNPKNIKLIHFKCHNRIHQRFEGMARNVYLVYGSPCSGKTTWVRDVANEDDLILDMDSIWESISVADKYHKPARLKNNAFGIRDCILDQIKCRVGLWRNAYVIGGYPLSTDRDRLCDLLGAQPIFIETSKDECIARAKTEEWREFVEEWFDSFTP